MQDFGAEHGILTQAWSPIDFELSADEITAIDGLDTGHRGGPEPDATTLETFGREIPEA